MEICLTSNKPAHFLHDSFSLRLASVELVHIIINYLFISLLILVHLFSYYSLVLVLCAESIVEDRFKAATNPNNTSCALHNRLYYFISKKIALIVQSDQRHLQIWSINDFCNLGLNQIV